MHSGCMYFNKDMAIDADGNLPVAQVMNRMVERHINENPVEDYHLIPYLEESFKINGNSHFDIDFDKVHSDAECGEYCYAASFLDADSDTDMTFFCDFSRESTLYVNGVCVANTATENEILMETRKVAVNLKKGKNIFLVKCRKNVLGYGFKIGSVSHRADPLLFRSAAKDTYGFLGWSYTESYNYDVLDKYSNVNDILDGEKWYPRKKDANHFADIFSNKYGYAYAASFVESGENAVASFVVETSAECTVFVNGQIAYSGKSGEFKHSLKSGSNYVIAEVKVCGKADFAIKCTEYDIQLPFVDDADYRLMYTGPFEEKDSKLTEDFDLRYLPGGKDYWRLCASVSLRLYEGKSLFGKWSYPLGVALWGMSKAYEKTKNERINEYLTEYIKKITDVYDYAQWDTEKYLLPYILRQQSRLELLDDFGSFGSALIETVNFGDRDKIAEITEKCADFVLNTLPRRENGMMYRKTLNNVSHNIDLYNHTAWADDLYMGACFMSKYYKFTGDEHFLNDAALQFERYFECMYMPDKKLMSHVYSFRHDKATRVAWGRGNGWVLFSLCELLKVMPGQHCKYEKMLEIFRTLCDGLIKYQDENGMWHQVISDLESFPETSCTSMFGYAFLNGIKNGWLSDEKYKSAAIRAWRAITKYTVDKQGNLYGVCKGSGYSFRENYYKKELPWRYNDTHGMGIVLLFGAEIADVI